jgi:hypothetical protein
LRFWGHGDSTQAALRQRPTTDWLDGAIARVQADTDRALSGVKEEVAAKAAVAAGDASQVRFRESGLGFALSDWKIATGRSVCILSVPSTSQRV